MKSYICAAAALMSALGVMAADKGKVEAYVTSADGKRMFAAESADLSAAGGKQDAIRLLPQTEYQTVDGFGAALTGSSCYNIMKMSEQDRKAFLRDVFDPVEGKGFSFIRLHIGGSDFSMDEYTCCDEPGIEFFAIPQIEREGIFPVLREILEIDPQIKIMGSPWSCPRWMKGTVEDPSVPFESWTSGRLNPKYYDDYAEYFVRWVNEMESEGFPIYAITIQNEPLNKGNSMSLYMPWEDQLAFVKVLGPAFRKAGIGTKILLFDHNYNYDNIASQQQYPLHIYADPEAAQYVDGSAWHSYGGRVSELDRIHSAAPDKSIYFTEASIGRWIADGTWEGVFDACILNDFDQIFLGTLTRYGKGVVLWNLMLDDKRSPYRPGGCGTCFGAVEIDSKDYSSLRYSSHYYDIAHCSKVIRPDAVRIGAEGGDGLKYAAFRNTDGSYALIVLNRSAADRAVTVQGESGAFEYTLPARSIASFRWSEK